MDITGPDFRNGIVHFSRGNTRSPGTLSVPKIWKDVLFEASVCTRQRCIFKYSQTSGTESVLRSILHTRNQYELFSTIVPTRSELVYINSGKYEYPWCPLPSARPMAHPPLASRHFIVASNSVDSSFYPLGWAYLLRAVVRLSISADTMANQRHRVMDKIYYNLLFIIEYE